MTGSRFVCLAALLGTLGGAFAQDRVASRLTGERVILVVPLVGSGTFDDPARPMFVPKAGESSAVQGFSWVATDDGKHAIVVLVGRRAGAFEEMLGDRRIVKAFLRGRDRREDVERELRRLKQDLSLEQLLGGVR